jgi:uracil-DNA glycosylase family 4
VTLDEKARLLAELGQVADACTACELSEHRTRVVFGSGSPSARVMFVGEAPGYNEDIQGEPFVGAAGKLLDELLREMVGITREEVYIGNVLKCRPPDNRDPTAHEIETCKPFLVKQIEIIQPDVICTLGNFATRTLTGRREGISKLRRKPIRVEEWYVFPMFHPAAALHRGDLYDDVRKDFEALKQFLDEPPEIEAEPSQMELF